MKHLSKYFFCLWCACAASVAVLWAKDDPVLMRVGGYDVPLSEFKYACRRTLRAPADVQLPLADLARDYADFRLQVQAARRAGLDTLPSFRRSQQLYRVGLLRSFLADSAVLHRALRRRYDRWAARGPRLLVEQIYFHLPQNVTASGLRAATARMDSIYHALQRAGQGAFGDFVSRFSDDKSRRWLMRLEETAEVEDTAFALRPGQWSRPFFSPRGLHIVRVVERRAVPPFEAVRDSLLQACPACVDEAVRAHAVRVAHARGTLSDGRLREVLMSECRRLEREDRAFRLAVQAHADSLLARAVARQALDETPDSAALQHFFRRHHARYRWDTARYRGIVLLCSSRRVAKRARKLLKHLPSSDWTNAIRLMFNREDTLVLARQGTFAPGQDAWVDERVFRQGEAPERRGYEHVVLLGRKLKGPEDYREVQAAVVADWKADCAKRWLSALRAAGKVEINQEVLKTVNYHSNKR